MQIKKRVYALDTQEEQQIREALRQMALNESYNTTVGYTAKGVVYEDASAAFIDKHMRYLATYPKLDAHVYLANLRLKTRIRP